MTFKCRLKSNNYTFLARRILARPKIESASTKARRSVLGLGRMNNMENKYALGNVTQGRYIIVNGVVHY